jgi:hypothetical protein
MLAGSMSRVDAYYEPEYLLISLVTVIWTVSDIPGTFFNMHVDTLFESLICEPLV